MIHPKTELRYINKEIGYGVVATEFIPAGSIVWIQDKLDREFKQEEIEALDQVYHDIIDTYTFRNRDGNYVLCWDNGRYINHSFNSNCLSTAYDFELAIRDIFPNEQLTDDYGYLNISEPFRAYDEGSSRKVVYPDDLLRYYKTWDKNLKAVFSIIPKLDQPLMPLVGSELWNEILLISNGHKEMKSILNNYYDQKENRMLRCG